MTHQWLAENSVVDPEVALWAKKQAITEFNIVQADEDAYYVTMRVNWRPELIHLATRRLRTEPRVFLNLGRLVKHIRENYVNLTEIKLILQSEQNEEQRVMGQKLKKRALKQEPQD